MTTMGNWAPRGFVTSDPRLDAAFTQHSQHYATITEYATETGIDTVTLMDLLAPALDNGTLTLESVGAEVFVHTAPGGRPTPGVLDQPPANLWEQLRTRRSPAAAAELWQALRRLQAAGWAVSAQPEQFLAALAPLDAPPAMAVSVYDRLAPVVLLPELPWLASAQSPLSVLARAGAAMVAVTLPSGALDDYVTATRSWFHATGATMTVLLLESPSYAPVALRSADPAVAPRAVSVHAATHGPAS